MATMTAMLGVMTTAFVIAVLSQKLVLSRWEKYIYNFVVNIELAKIHKSNAANVIKTSWKIWKLNQKGERNSLGYHSAQRQFYESIKQIKEVKNARRNFTDNILGFAEVMMAQRETLSKNDTMESQMDMLTRRMDRMEETLNNIVHAIQSIENKLDRSLPESVYF